MKKDYLKPEIELIRLEMIDLITVSGPDFGDPEEDELPLVPAVKPKT